MIDIELLEGDFRIKKVKEVDGEVFYDLDLIEDNVNQVIKRALLTPLGHIRCVIFEQNGINIIDSEYGNSLYELLAAPLNFDWYTKIREIVINTIENLNISTLTINDVALKMPDLQTVIVEVNYSYSGSTDTVVVEI